MSIVVLSNARPFLPGYGKAGALPIDLDGAIPAVETAKPFAFDMTLSGGTAPYTALLLSPPPDLDIELAGETVHFSGLAGAANPDLVVNLKVTDAAGRNRTFALHMVITAAVIPLALDGEFAPAAQGGVAYSSAVDILGGAADADLEIILTGELPPTYTASIVAGQLVIEGTD